jgi:hypothetical protein
MSVFRLMRGSWYSGRCCGVLWRRIYLGRFWTPLVRRVTG